MSALLSVEGLTVEYSGLRAVKSVDMEVEKGTVVGLIGPNGAGKTSFIDALTGFTATSAGQVRFRDRNIENLPPHKRARLGLARSFQSVELFEDLTIAENLQVAVERPRLSQLILDTVLPGRGDHAEGIAWAVEQTGISPLMNRWPTELSTGERALVGVARSLAGRPDLVLLDEPAAGLSTKESADLGLRLRSVAEAGVTVLLVDHDMGLVLSVCDRIYVLEFGSLIAEGRPEEIRKDARVITAYLGSAGSAEDRALEPAIQALPEVGR